jgi:hypothetical protein
MSRRFVDAIWIRQRMDRKDARVQAAARTQAERAAFHLLLTNPGTAARLDAALAENARIDAQLREDDRLEDLREGDERGGCSAQCGYCGSCS